MTGRELSAAECRQRREARTQHGAYSEATIRPRSEVNYRRLLKALNKAVGRTTPAERRQLRYLAYYEARRTTGEEWLAAHAVRGLFLDEKSGRLHPLSSRNRYWFREAPAWIASWSTDLFQRRGRIGDHYVPVRTPTIHRFVGFYLARIFRYVGQGEEIKPSDDTDGHHYAAACYADLFISGDVALGETCALIPASEATTRTLEEFAVTHLDW